MKRLMRRFQCAPLLLVLGASLEGAPPFGIDVRAEFTKAIDTFEDAQQLLADQPDRARQLFRTAAQRFETVIATGIVNGQLEYNLGNCYMQAGNLGRGILHYRRAHRLIPGDPWLQDNLREARKRRITNIVATKRSAVLRNLFFIHYDTSVHGRTKALIAFYFLFWGLLGVRTFVSRRFVTGAAVACAFACCTMGVSVGCSIWNDQHNPEGIVTEMDVAVFKGPGTGYQHQFDQPLQPGAEFTLRERRGSWWSIELPDGKLGWIEATRAELIPS